MRGGCSLCYYARVGEYFYSRNWMEEIDAAHTLTEEHQKLPYPRLHDISNPTSFRVCVSGSSLCVCARTRVRVETRGGVMYRSPMLSYI